MTLKVGGSELTASSDENGAFAFPPVDKDELGDAWLESETALRAAGVDAPSAGVYAAGLLAGDPVPGIDVSLEQIYPKVDVQREEDINALDSTWKDHVFLDFRPGRDFESVDELLGAVDYLHSRPRPTLPPVARTTPPPTEEPTETQQLQDTTPPETQQPQQTEQPEDTEAPAETDRPNS